MRPSILLSLLALAALISFSLAISPPPVFEHKMAREYDKTNCEVCQAVIKQALRKIPVGAPDLSTQKMRRKREQKVSDTLEGICAVESFSRYEFSPPTMVSACNDFITNNGETLENLLFKGVTDDVSMRTRLCIDESKLCKTLWTPEEEEMKRDRSPEEARAESEAAQRQAKEESARKKAEEKQKKAEERAAKLEALEKKKQDALAAKKKREEEEAAKAAGADKTEL